MKTAAISFMETRIQFIRLKQNRLNFIIYEEINCVFFV